MIAVLLWTVGGAAVAASLWALGHQMFEVGPLQRTNYRDAPLVTGVGVLIPVTLLALGAVGALVDRAELAAAGWNSLLLPASVAAVGFSLLGLLDDVAGVGQSGGFRGHLGALSRGRLTSGMVKLAGGAALGVVVASQVPAVGMVAGGGDLRYGVPSTGAEGVLVLLRDGAVVALAANLANLFDRAPGRVVKVAALGFAVVAAVSRSAALAVPAGGIGAGIGLLRADLSERCMLGDAGSNVLGALCGLGALIAAPSSTARWLVLAGLLLANAASEAVSFSRVIDAVAPLRWLDRVGSKRPR